MKFGESQRDLQILPFKSARDKKQKIRQLYVSVGHLHSVKFSKIYRVWVIMLR